MLAVERCHLDVEAVVATPYASGLAVLVDDEAEMGVVVVDMGGGTTSLGVFAGGHLVHADASRSAATTSPWTWRAASRPVSPAERLKTLHGSCISSAVRRARHVSVPQVDEDERDAPTICRSRIWCGSSPARRGDPRTGARPPEGCRLLRRDGSPRRPDGRRSQLTGLPELARRILGEARCGSAGRSASGPAGSRQGTGLRGAVGLLIYPQVAASSISCRARRSYLATGTDGYLSRVGRWIKDSF
jgi:cell division protein FtsA